MADQEDPLTRDVKQGIENWRDYDEYALDQYHALSFYFSQRKAGLTLAQAQAATCDVFGHDAPRGKCVRCGLGVELGEPEKDRRRARVAERDAWLQARHSHMPR